MGYGYYVTKRLNNYAIEIKRGYSVECKCHKRGCKERIDRGMAFLCYSCGWYFCENHRTMAYCKKHDKPIIVECFAGESNEVCDKCCRELQAYYKNNSCDDDHEEN